jgi:hypothetical protein
MRTILALTLCTIAAIILASLATAEVPQRINYQGRLTDAGGNPVTGSYQIKFTIWDDPTASAPANEKWTSGVQTVQVTDGAFIYELGSIIQLPLDLFATDTVRWLGIKVGTDAEITPRTRLTSVPYAYQALRADTADFALGSGNWSVTGSVLFTNGYWGIARGGAGNALYGDSTHTMVNLGVASTTGSAAKQDGAYATVSGGLDNTASGDYSTVSGGGYNTASGPYSVVAGGTNSLASEIYCTVGGGYFNIAIGDFSTVGGGLYDTASGTCGTVPGGSRNVASGDYAFAAGENAKARHDNTFVWSDGAAGRQDFESTGPNQFLIQAAGNVGIGTADPQAPLHVAGTIQGEAAFYFDENADLGYENAVIGFDYSNPNDLCDRRLRITAGRDDGVANTQGACIDLHGNQRPQDTWEGGELHLVAGDAGGPILFYTGIACVAERMRIDSIGHVGIGALPNPVELLHVAGTIEGEAAFFFDENADFDDVVTNNAVIGFNFADREIVSDRRLRITAGRDDGVANSQGACIDLHGNQRPQDTDFGGELHLAAGSDGGPILFYTGPPDERMRITSDGYVGIGTQDPHQRLTVEGAIELVSPEDSTRSLITTTNQDAGGIFTYGPNNKRNIFLAHTLDNANHGFIGVLDDNGADEKAAMHVCPHSSGRIYTRGADNSLNVAIDHPAGSINHGLISVFDNARSGTEQAGIYVDTLGNGIVWGDTKSFRVENPSQPGTDIWYTCPEGPEAAAYIRGTGHLVNGTAVITFPDHFRTVANPDGITIQLTPLSAESRGLAVVEKTLDRLVVRELSNGGGTYDFDYLVMAVRQGYENYQVIRSSTEGKAPEVVKGAEILLDQ